MYRHVWNSCSATIRRSFLWFALVRSSQRSWDLDRSTIWLVSRLSCVNFGSSRTPMIQTLAEGQTLGGWVNLGWTYPNWSGHAIWSAEFSTESLAFTQYMKRCHAGPFWTSSSNMKRCHAMPCPREAHGWESNVVTSCKLGNDPGKDWPMEVTIKTSADPPKQADLWRRKAWWTTLTFQDFPGFNLLENLGVCLDINLDSSGNRVSIRKMIIYLI
jgi:hypothetical protein